MGLDWMVQEKFDEQGNEVHPAQTAGAKRYDPNDEKTVSIARTIWEQRYGKDSRQPGKMSLEDFLAMMEKDRPLLPDTIPEDCPGLARVTGMLCSSIDFRGKVIGNMGFLPETLVNRAYENMTPEQMLEYADDLERYAGMARGDQATWLEAAIVWLRYWGSRGHPIAAWY